MLNKRSVERNSSFVEDEVYGDIGAEKAAMTKLHRLPLYVVCQAFKPGYLPR